MVDHKEATYSELKAKFEMMEVDFKKQLNEMSQRVEQARKNEQADALKKIRSIMQSYNLSPSDFGMPGKAKKIKTTGSVPVKYRGPNGATWTGRGRAPQWIVGLDREQFKVER